MAGHTRRCMSVLVVYVLFCVYKYSFAVLIRRTLPSTFNNTAVTDRHYDTTIFHLEHTVMRLSWSIGSEKSLRHVPPVMRLSWSIGSEKSLRHVPPVMRLSWSIGSEKSLRHVPPVIRLSWSIGSEKSLRHVPPVGVEPSTSCMNGDDPILLARRSAFWIDRQTSSIYIWAYNKI